MRALIVGLMICTACVALAADPPSTGPSKQDAWKRDAWKRDPIVRPAWQQAPIVDQPPTAPKYLTDEQMDAKTRPSNIFDQFDAKPPSAIRDLASVLMLGMTGVGAFMAMILGSRGFTGWGLGFTRLWIVLVGLASAFPIGFSLDVFVEWYTENIFAKYDANYRTLWQRGDFYFISAAVIPVIGAAVWGMAFWVARGFTQVKKR